MNLQPAASRMDPAGFFMQLEKIHLCTGHRAALYALAHGRDERHFLSAGGDGWIVEWNLDQPDLGRLIAQTNRRIFSIARLGDAQMVAGSMEGEIHWINLNRPEQSRVIAAHKKGVFALEPIGRHRLLSAGGDGMLTLWDTLEIRPLASIQLSTQTIRCIAYSAARNELTVGAGDGNIIFLDAGMLAVKGTFQHAHDNSVFSVAYSPDARFLLSGGRDAHLRVWELSAESDSVPWPSGLSPELPAHMQTINHIAFSPDNRWFATASRDKTLKIWDAANMELLKVMDVHRGGHLRSVNRLLWMGDILASCGDDQSVILWKVAPGGEKNSV